MLNIEWNTTIQVGGGGRLIWPFNEHENVHFDHA